MAVIQTNFGDDFAQGFPGMVANGETSNRISRTIEDAAGIGFGKAAFRGAGDHGITATPNANFMGWAMVDKGVPMFAAGQVADTYPQYHNVPLFPKGVIWVLAGAALADGADIGVTVAGAVVAAADVGVGGVALTGWVADMTVAQGAVLRVTNNRHPAA